jgi:hypothetical protein
MRSCILPLALSSLDRKYTVHTCYISELFQQPFHTSTNNFHHLELESWDLRPRNDVTISPVMTPALTSKPAARCRHKPVNNWHPSPSRKPAVFPETQRVICMNRLRLEPRCTVRSQQQQHSAREYPRIHAGRSTTVCRRITVNEATAGSFVIRKKA